MLASSRLVLLSEVVIEIARVLLVLVVGSSSSQALRQEDVRPAECDKRGRGARMDRTVFLATIPASRACSLFPIASYYILPEQLFM
jgi:hypothetical protein